MTIYKLSDIFTLQMGKTPARKNMKYWENGNNKWISISDLSSYDKYVSDTKEKITDQAIKETGIKIIPANTVIMSFKLSIGKTAITQEPVYSNEAIMAFIDKGVVPMIPDYIYYLFKYKKWDEETNKAVMGKTLNKATLANVQIDINSIEEQQKIVSILDGTNRILSNQKAKLKKLDILIKARFVEMFGDPVGNDYYWKQTKLKEVSTKIGSGATPRGGRDSYCSEGISLIRSLNVYDGKFEYKDLAHISNEQAKKLNNVTVNKNDILINITGASVARTCIVPEDVLPARVNQHVSIIRCKADILNPVFINRMFLSDSYKNQLLNIGESGGATRQAITKDQLESLTIIVPPIKLQNQFAAFVQKTDKSKAVIQESIDKTQMLFDSLMQEYFS
jgi:type I restriction enzyme S subunit